MGWIDKSDCLGGFLDSPAVMTKRAWITDNDICTVDTFYFTLKALIAEFGLQLTSHLLDLTLSTYTCSTHGTPSKSFISSIQHS